MTQWSETLERDITIGARRDTVFRYFTDSARFARWWGEGSQIDARPGGEVLIRYPNGIVARGRVVEIEPPRRVAFTYNMSGSASAEESLVTITLEESEDGTRLHLHHAFTSAKVRDHFVQGWRYQLALFSRIVAEQVHADVAGRVDAFLAAWGEPDGETRRALLESCAVPSLVFRDAFSATTGLDDMLANLEAVQIHMPATRLARDGDVRLTHSTAIARWKAQKDTGEPLGRGLNVFDLAPDGRIARVIGFWESEHA